VRTTATTLCKKCVTKAHSLRDISGEYPIFAVIPLIRDIEHLSLKGNDSVTLCGIKRET
jgi:hypothetical protein